MLGVKGQDLNSISEVSKSRGASNYYREYLVDSLISSGRIQEATIEARELVELEPRSWRGWVAIALSPVAKPHERRVASETLKKLDPNNMELQAAPIWGEQNDTG
jgi:hypothetical protein